MKEFRVSPAEVRIRIRQTMDFVTQSILSGVPPCFEGILDTKNSTNDVLFDF
jgi:hypothetical protein